jgi:hypothetical protein
MANLNMDYNMNIDMKIQTNVYNMINNMYHNGDFNTFGSKYNVISCFFHQKGGGKIIQRQ